MRLEAEQQKTILAIAAGAGIISALLPSVPTIVRFWDDDTPITVLGHEMPYSQFLHIWVALLVIGLAIMVAKVVG